MRLRRKNLERGREREKGTLKNEGGFADASGAVKEEGLGDTVVLRVVVENGF